MFRLSMRFLSMVIMYREVGFCLDSYSGLLCVTYYIVVLFYGIVSGTLKLKN
jgi:hypothetical protein